MCWRGVNDETRLDAELLGKAFCKLAFEMHRRMGRSFRHGAYCDLQNSGGLDARQLIGRAIAANEPDKAESREGLCDPGLRLAFPSHRQKSSGPARYNGILLPADGARILTRLGEVPKRSQRHRLEIGWRLIPSRGFESHPLRQPLKGLLVRKVHRLRTAFAGSRAKANIGGSEAIAVIGAYVSPATLSYAVAIRGLCWCRGVAPPVDLIARHSALNPVLDFLPPFS